ncbi:MAG: alpha,alpha-trehalase TreF [Chitinophagaceae bacterium]
MEKVEIHELNPLFDDVQKQKVFADGKTFVDCLNKKNLQEILEEYQHSKESPGFDLKEFVHMHFELPHVPETGFTSSEGRDVVDHIEALWPVLTRMPDEKKGSLIPLPFSYIVPGGRFGEIYYWDSYFTMLGLKASGKIQMIENMVKNFSHLIETIGYIPNGNRTYYIGRSQPPFFSLMVRLLSELKGKPVLIDFLPGLEKEYDFWMKGNDAVNEKEPAIHHVVQMPQGEILNRYWDESETPRPESYREDVELAQQSGEDPKKIYRHLRAGAESGWDFSSRWFKDKKSFTSIHTTGIVPVDLNVLLMHLEQTIAEAYQLKTNRDLAASYQILAENRKKAIQKYCWSDRHGFYFDYDFMNESQAESLTLAGAFPLFFQMATTDQAARVARVIKDKFLQAGGVVTTLETTGQQWDAPNGWAPLQWIVINGLEKYDQTELAKDIAGRWIKLNTDVFKRTGKLMEKYNVMDTHLEAGGGEYPGQDGFGWTNGVLLALIKKYGSS